MVGNGIPGKDMGKSYCNATDKVFGSKWSDEDKQERPCSDECPGVSCQHCEQGIGVDCGHVQKKSKWHGWTWEK